MQQSKMLYAAPVWAEYLQRSSYFNKMNSVQRFSTLRIVSGYRTVLVECVALVLAGTPAKQLLAQERTEIHWTTKAITAESQNKKKSKRTAKSVLLKDGSNYGTWKRKEGDNLIGDLRTWLERSHNEMSYLPVASLSGHGFYKRSLCRLR